MHSQSALTSLTMPARQESRPFGGGDHSNFIGYGARAYLDPAGKRSILWVPATISRVNRHDDSHATVFIESCENGYDNSPAKSGYSPLDINPYPIHFGKGLDGYWYPKSEYNSYLFRLPDSLVNDSNFLLPTPGRGCGIQPVTPKDPKKTLHLVLKSIAPTPKDPEKTLHLILKNHKKQQ